MERFTPTQIREFNDAFYMYDTEGKGTIPSTELRGAFGTIGMNPTDRLLEIFRTELEEDNGEDGVVDFEGFIQLIDRMETEQKVEREAREAYNAFDIDRRGFIPAVDIKA